MEVFHTPILEETPGQTTNTLEGLHILSGLGALQVPRGGLNDVSRDNDNNATLLSLLPP